MCLRLDTLAQVKQSSSTAKGNISISRGKCNDEALCSCIITTAKQCTDDLLTRGKSNVITTKKRKLSIDSDIMESATNQSKHIKRETMLLETQADDVSSESIHSEIRPDTSALLLKDTTSSIPQPMSIVSNTTMTTGVADVYPSTETDLSTGNNNRCVARC